MKKLFLAFLLVLAKGVSAQQPKLMLPLGHTGYILNAVFSPDSKYIATSSEDKTVKIWDALSGKLLADLNGFFDEVRSVAFSRDSRQLLTRTEKNAVQVWESRTGKLLSDSIKGKFAEFSADGKWILAFNDGKFTIWNTSSLLRTGTIDLNNVSRFADMGYCIISPDNKKLVTIIGGHGIMTTYMWDIPGHKFLGELGEGVLDLARTRDPEFSADGSALITHPNDSSIKVWNTADGQLLYETRTGLQQLITAALSANGKTLHTTWKTGDETITKLTNLEGKQELNEIKQIGSTTGFNDDRTKFITDDINNELSVWDMASGKLISKLKYTDTVVIYYSAFTPDSKYFLAVMGNSTMQEWEVSSGKTIFKTTVNTYYYQPHFSADGKLIFMAGEIRSASTGKLLVSYNDIGLYNMLSPNGNSLFSWDRTRFVGHLQNCKLFSIGKTEAVSNFEGHVSNALENVTFAPGGKKLLFLRDNVITAWNISDGKLMYNLVPNVKFDRRKGVSFSSDGKKIILTGYDNTLLWNIDNGNLVADANEITHENNHFSFCDGEKFLARSDADSSSINVWDIKSGKFLLTLKGHTAKINYIAVDELRQKAATASADSTAKLWDMNSGQLLASFKMNGIVNSVVFSHDGKKILTASGDSTIAVWDINSQKLLLKHNADNNIMYAEFSPNDKNQLTVDSFFNLRVWDNKPYHYTDLAHTSEFFPVFDKTGNSIIYADQRFVADDYSFQSQVLFTDKVVTHSDSGITGHVYSLSPQQDKFVTLKNTAAYVYDLDKVKQQFSLVLLDSTDYLVQIPSGYYKCSPNAAKLLNYVTGDLRTIGFEQLDIKYNRPGLVLEAMGSNDTSLIRAYKKAWQKRIKKLGFDTAFFNNSLHLPESDFQNRDAVSYEQSSKTLTLKIKAKDDSLTLDRYNVWINDVPVFGVKGIPLKYKNTNSIDTTIQVELSNGENHIECSVTNTGGLESYRVPLEVNYKPVNPSPEKLYFIGIGIDRFNESKYNLSWSVKDIYDLANKFKEKYGKDCIIDTLFNENVTVEKITALKNELLSSSENDKVIVAYSGHGLLSDSLDYFLSTYNVNFHKPEIGGLPYESLENLLDNIPARKKLLLIDACHSGEVDKEEMTKMAAVQKDLDPGKKGIIIVVDSTNKKMGIKNSFELMQELFANIGKSTGTTVISAASGTQFALERGDLKNGIFTYSILEAMENKPSINLNELKKVVTHRVKELSKDLQSPTFRNETQDFDWKVW